MKKECECGANVLCMCPTPNVDQVNNMPGHRNPPPPPQKEQVNHPQHYGGEDNPYEAIKVIEAWDLDFHLGNTANILLFLNKDVLVEFSKSLLFSSH